MGRGISNIFLDDVGYSNIDAYGGCFSCDNIPTYTSLPVVYIVNLSEVGHPGSHFVCLTISVKRKLVYFDSFGQQCNNAAILQYMNAVAIKYTYNPIQIQSLESEYCGLFCLGAAIQYNRTGCLNEFINIFNDQDLARNDIVIVDYITKYI